MREKVAAALVRITCGELSGCDLSHDTAGVIFSLSPGSCEELANGTAAIVGRIETTLSCPSLTCSTVGLRRWSEVAEGTIPPGDYTVRAHIDVDRDGLVGAGGAGLSADQRAAHSIHSLPIPMTAALSSPKPTTVA
jgi:hypothetical protein